MSKKNSPSPHSEESRRLSAIFQNSQDGIITISQDGIIESVNPAAAKLFGYIPEEIIDRNIKILMPEPYHSAHDGYIRNYQQTGKRKIIGIGREVTGKRKDKTLFPFFLSVSEVQLDNRKIFTGFIHDISELKNKKTELEENENRLNAILETAVDGIIVIDRRGVIMNINPAVTKLFGYTSEELIGQNIKVLMPEPDHSRHDQYIDNYQTTRQAKIIGIGREVQGKKKDGTLFPFNLGVSEIKTQAGIIYTGIIHDLTIYKKRESEIKELNQLLEQKVKTRTQELSETVNKLLNANKKLEFEIGERKKIEEALRQTEIEILEALNKEKELGELKSRFVSMASHEFRTPLSTILSSVSLISRYTLSEQQEKRDKHIHRIKSAVNNLTNILNDFLSISKLEEGKVDHQPELFELDTFCLEVIDELEGLLKKGQKINYQYQSDRNSSVFLDKRLLKNILLNLLSNAIKYSPEEKIIDCSVHLLENQLQLHIVDQGIGIPLKDQQYLFTRFFRAANATNIQGTGLGLNIVKKYVDLMDGTITFKSQASVGTTFTVRLPLKNDSLTNPSL